MQLYWAATSLDCSVDTVHNGSVHTYGGHSDYVTAFHFAGCLPFDTAATWHMTSRNPITGKLPVSTKPLTVLLKNGFDTPNFLSIISVYVLSCLFAFAYQPVCSLYVVVRPSVCLSVMFVHPTQAIEIFGNVSMPFNTLVIWQHPGKILRRWSQARGTPPWGELNTRGVAKYSDFGPFRDYISKTVQDRR